MRARHEIRGGGGARLRTLVIGRSPSADVVIADASLAPHHAELVITDDGRLYLTDCATDGGTWVIVGGESASGWQPVRQGFVHHDQPLRLGDHQCTVGDLLRRRRGAPADVSASGGAWDGGRVRGPVARDPVTGEIVRRRP
jgi:predicted component of type VI protein secretion system